MNNDYTKVSIEMPQLLGFTHTTHDGFPSSAASALGLAADIVTPTKIINIKSSWSLSTFHVLVEDGLNKTVEWQGRAYMWLWDVEEFEVHYCLVNTPEELIGYESETLHLVDHINPALRLSRVVYQRDRELEEKIKIRVDAAREYIDQVVV